MKTAVATPLDTRLLLIADDTLLLNTLKDALESSITSVHVLQTVFDVIDHLKTTPEDVIVLDISSVGALELIQLLKKNSATKPIPIIAVGGQAQEEQLERALENGANEVLSRPFLPLELQQRIQMQHKFLALKRTVALVQQPDVVNSTAINILSEGYVVLNTDHVIEFANQAAANILKIDVKDLIGKKMISAHWRAHHEDGTPFAEEEYPSFIAIKTLAIVKDVLMVLQDGAGQKTILLVNASPIMEKDNRVTGAVTTFQDITQIKFAEKQYKSFFKENIMPLYWVEMRNPIPISLPVKEQVRALFREAIIKDLSLPMVPLYEFEKPEDIIGKPMTNAFSPDSVMPDSPTFAFFETMFSNGYVAQDVERFGKNQNNVEKCFLNNATAIIENGHITRIFGSQLDVTDQKIAQQNVSEREEFLRAIVENSMNAIMVADDLGNYISANQAASDLFGYSIEELTQMNVGQLKTVNENVPERFNEYLQKGKEVGEWSFLDANDEPKVVQYHAIRVRENFNLSILSDISEQKKTQESLMASETKFRTLANTAQMGISILTSHNGLRFEYVNQTWENITGFSQEEALSMEPSMLVHEDYAELATQRAKDRLLGKTPPDRYEMKIVTKSKEIKWVEVRSKMVIFDDQAGLLTTSLDITERKEHEKQQLYFKNFMDTSSEVVSYWEVPQGVKADMPLQKQIDTLYNSICSDCNSAVVKLFEKTHKNEIIGKRYLDFIQEKTYDKVYTTFIKNGYRLSNYEAYQILDNGKMKFTLENWHGVFEDNYLKYIWVSSTDISDRKLAELKLKESETKFYNAFNSSPVALAVVNLKNGERLAVNTEFCNLFGLTHEEAMDLNLEDKALAVDESKLKEALQIAGKKGELEDYPLDMRDASGNLKNILVSATNTFLADRDIFIVSYMDMTSIVEAEKKLKKAETQIFQTMIQAEEKERARYAKELHDGLGPILSTSMIYLHTMLKEKDRQKQEGYINRAYSLLEDAMQSIREISSNLSPDILKKYGLVHAVRSFIERLQEVSNVEFKISSSLKKTLPDIVAFTLYRTLTELITNSIKHADAKQVRITFEESDKQIKIVFADNGKGFDYDKVKRTNTGFGLLNLETRIHKIGGHYKLVSSKEKGTKVTITIQKTEHDSFSYN